MSGTNKKLRAAVETYFRELRMVRASGGAAGKQSLHTPPAHLPSVVGSTVKLEVILVDKIAGSRFISIKVNPRNAAVASWS